MPLKLRLSTIVALNKLQRHRRELFAALVFSWMVLTTESQFLWWLYWCLVGGPSPADPLLTHDCPSRNYSLPVAVVIPLIAGQMKRLEWSMSRWADERYEPCGMNETMSTKVTLVFYFDKSIDEGETAKATQKARDIAEGVGRIGEVVRRCFKGGVEYASAELGERETKNSYGMDIFRNLMQTGGSNRQFERVFQVLGGGRFRHFLYMEPDLWALRSAWLARVLEEMAWGDFWMRGSVMRYRPRFNVGWEPFRSSYQRHLNGNAIYALDDKCFARYRELVRGVYGDGAFDVAMSYYRMSLKRVETYQMIAHRFAVSEVMTDLGVARFTEEEVRERFAGTYLVHGKFMHVSHAWVNFMQYR